MTAKNLLCELLRLEKEGVDLDNDVYFKAPNLSPYDDIDIDFVTGSEETGEDQTACQRGGGKDPRGVRA